MVGLGVITHCGPKESQMASNNKPIDPAIIINKCDEALKECRCWLFMFAKMLEGDGHGDPPKLFKQTMLKARAARAMIKEYENG